MLLSTPPFTIKTQILPIYIIIIIIIIIIAN